MLVTEVSQLKQVADFIARTPIISYDIETNSLNPRTGKVIGIGISDASTSFYLPLLRWNGSELEPVLPTAAVLEVLQPLKHKKLLAYNAAFDLQFTLNQLGLDLVDALHADVLLLVHTCDENRYTYGLKDVAASVFGTDVKAEQAEVKASVKANGGSDGELYRAELPIIAKYCEQDCKMTYWLYERFLPQLRADGLEQFFFADEVMPLYKLVTIPMAAEGVRIDLPLVQQALVEINTDIAELEHSIQSQIAEHLAAFNAWFLLKDYPPARTGEFAQAIAEYADLPLPKTKSGKYSIAEAALEALPDSHWKQVLQQKAYMTPAEVHDIQQLLWSKEGKQYMFNLSSKDHLKRLFFTQLKEQPLSRTPKGAPQVDDDFLDLMAKKYAWAEELRTYNRLIKIRGTYIERFLERAEGDIFYPQWKQHGTQTGRFSGDLQQLPRMLEDGQAPEVVIKHTNNIRNFFIAKEGHVLIDADYESLEPHVFAHISREPVIIDVFNKGHDFYSAVALSVEKLEGYSADKSAPNYLGKLAKTKRQTAKAYALGLAYGMEAYKLSHDLGIEQDEAQQLVDGYWAGFPVLKQTSDAGREQIMERGYIASEFGRRRRLHEARQIAQKHGTDILNSLELWKKYNETPALYEQMKRVRRTLKNALNAAINFPTQSSAASIINRASIALMKAYKEASIPATIIMQCHDELLVSCRLGFESQAAAVMQHIMENSTKLLVALKAEPVIGLRYGEIK